MDTQKPTQVAVIGEGPVPNTIIDELNKADSFEVVENGGGMAEPVEPETTVQSEKSTKDYKVDKFKALYQCRAILSKHGTMKEREVCKRQLERMKKLGLGAL